MLKAIGLSCYTVVDGEPAAAIKMRPRHQTVYKWYLHSGHPGQQHFPLHFDDRLETGRVE